MAFYFCHILKKVVNNIKKSKLFPCYSIPLRDFLTSKGIRYELDCAKDNNAHIVQI